MAMHAQPVPKLGVAPSPVAKTASRQLPSVGMCHPSHADKKVAQHHYSASFDSSDFVANHPAPESRCEELQKLTDPRGHLLEMLDIKPPRDQDNVDVDFLRERNPTKVKTRNPSTKPAAPNPLLRTPAFRNASSFCSGASSAGNRQAVRRGSTSLTLRSSNRKPGSLEKPTSQDEDQHAPSRPTQPPSAGPRPLRRFSDASRLLVRNHHAALTHPPSDISPARAPKEGRIRIVWQPPSNFTYGIVDDFLPERTTLNPEPFVAPTPTLLPEAEPKPSPPKPNP